VGILYVDRSGHGDEDNKVTIVEEHEANDP
jgi:hypothetical protein